MKKKATKKSAPTKKRAAKKAAKFALGLRTCRADGTPFHPNGSGFVWPKSGRVECPDWNSRAECGGGLHFLMWGEGDWSLLSEDQSALWQVIQVEVDKCIAIDGGQKYKAPSCEVVYSGERAEAITRVLCSADKPVDEKSSGNSSKAASSGYYSTAASSGDHSKAASSGDSSTAASSGYYSKAASSGYYSKAASSGDSSTAASSGDSSKAASSGDYSTAASSGENTIAMAAGVGYVQAGKNGCIATAWWDGKRYRAVAGNIGETLDGSGNVLEPDVMYRLDDKGAWRKAS